MLSGIGRLIREHREGVGMALIGIGFFWLTLEDYPGYTPITISSGSEA